jgi:hypothetical protein
MGTLVRWLRLVSGLSLGLLLLALSPVAFTDDSVEPAFERLMLVLGLVGFALLAAGWGLAALWDSAGMVLRGGGVVVFGLAMAAFVVTELSIPGWLGWTLFGLFAVAGVAFPVWLFLGGDRGSSLVEPDAQGRLEVPVARVPTVMLAVLAAAMATLALVLLPIPVVGWVVGPLGLVFFGGVCAGLVLLAIRPGPGIRADTKGMGPVEPDRHRQNRLGGGGTHPGDEHVRSALGRGHPSRVGECGGSSSRMEATAHQAQPEADGLR